MQIKGKILTIAGIIMIFGYFISESFKDPSDPTQVVMVGNDTLGRDWGAMAEQIEREKMQQQNGGVEEGIEVLSGEMDESANTSLLDPSQDPLNRQKLDQNNYYSIESPDGREITTPARTGRATNDLQRIKNILRYNLNLILYECKCRFFKPSAYISASSAC